MTIREVLREEYLKRSEEIHRIKTENKIQLPWSEHWPRYKVAKDEASLILIAIRITKLFPDEIKRLLSPAVPYKTLGYSTRLQMMVADSKYAMERQELRYRILSNIAKIKPHCHKKAARKMVKRAIKWLGQQFNGSNIEELFYVKPVDFAPQA